jgi:hypothetical protein
VLQLNTVVWLYFLHDFAFVVLPLAALSAPPPSNHETSTDSQAEKSSRVALMRFCLLLAVSVAVVECALAFAPPPAISSSTPAFHPDAQMSNFYHAWCACRARRSCNSIFLILFGSQVCVLPP